MINELLKKYTSIKEDKEKVSAYLKDNSIPMNDRKEFFNNMPECLGTIYRWILHPAKYQEKYGEISWYDDFYVERGNTVMFSEIADKLNDLEDWEERTNLLMEDFIETGIVGFIFDW